MASLSDAQLKTIADKLFLLQPSAATKLPKPKNTSGANSLATRLDPIATDARFTEIGIGVVDFTASVTSPKVWLHNGDDSWRTGSTGKISVLLAAMQLRNDVRLVQGSNLLSTPEEYDNLFANPKLWAKAPDWRTGQIAGKDHAPRISTIFDFTKSPKVDFFGPSPDAPNATDIITRLNAASGAHLQWAHAHNFDFSERLWLMGARSDNRAATSCISEIGVAYLKAVQRAYGLFDEKNGMHLLMAGYYSDFKDNALVSNRSATITFRRLQNVEPHPVKDATHTKSSPKVFDDKSSWEPGSAAALLAYMIALKQDKLVVTSPPDEGKKACAIVRKNLSHGVAGQTQSHLVNGVKETGAQVTDQITKIGLLGKEDFEPGPLNCEFAYMETEETSAGKKKMQYGVVVSGIRSKPNPDGTPGPLSAVNMTRDIGMLVHTALLKP